MAQALPIISAATSIYSGIRGARSSGGGGGNSGDPFGQYRGQFGAQLATLFGNGNTPEWMRPGEGLDMGQGLRPGEGMPVGGEGMASEGLVDPTLLNFDASQIENDPAYRFQLRSGSDAISSQRAASGQLNSGGTLAELAGFGQGLATNFTNQQFNRNMGRFGAQLNAFNTLNAAQGQRFGQQFGVQNAGFTQALQALQARNAAQGQRFGQGSTYANFLAQLAGATQSPAAGAEAASRAQSQRRQGFGDIIGGLGALSRTGFPSFGGGAPGADVWAGGGYGG